MQPRFALSVLAALSILLLIQTSKAAPFQPVFDPNNFTTGAAIDNPYFPLPIGTTFKETATVHDPDTGETGFQIDSNTVTNKTINLGGVQARVVHATSVLDGLLIEDTNDYYAQDKAGNVWYLGEDTKAFEYDDNDNLISTDTSGSWHTGVHGALPGFIMPNAAQQIVGFFYVQEDAPQDGAQDQAEIVSLNESVTVPAGSFTNVLKTLETSPQEPGVQENKFYAKGFGEIQVFEDLQDDGKPLNTFVLESVTTGGGTAIPIPPAAYASFVTIAAGAVVHFCRRGRFL
ncbi:MAG TPA: hypothetical protein VL282_12380 [Tepidisphaeraceae bacterium]|jgi:hypothetical protein|nr:hypothetical protein [Tepidisphaeraceae bacterium]